MTPPTLRALAWLPGETLPRSTWERRHARLQGLLWALIGAGVVLRWAWPSPWTDPPGSEVVWVAWMVVPAAVGALPWRGLSERAQRQLRSCATSYALMIWACWAVALTGGASEAHFLFFILVPLVALYEAWAPFLLVVALVVVEHGVLGALVPAAVYGEDVASDDAWRMAAVHGALFAFACASALLAWRGADSARTEAASVVALLERQTRHDELTGLANRRGLAEELDRVLRLLRDSAADDAGDDAADDSAESLPVAVIVMDLNRFKEVNDTLGHSAGDALLRSVAATMSGVVEGIGLLARLGGDEFALVLPGADGQAGTAIADLLRQHLREGAEVGGVELDLDLSAGVAVHAGGEVLDGAGRARVAEELLRHADIAMYAAKAAGGGATEFDPALDHHSTARLEIARDLRIAVERDDELVLYFQPKLSAVDGRLVGVEALVRWMHPHRGFMPPGDFIPVLERTDLVHAFTAKVLQLGLDQARAWLDAGYDVPVAVNVSPRCLTQPGFAGSLALMLATRSLPPHLLRVEITEDALVADPEAAAAVITELRAMGVKTSIDDFGTGYSSLSYLRRLPVDEVKLDRAFVTGLGSGEGEQGGGDRVLVSSIIELAHRLDMHVVAEGVEHAHELGVLRELGCDVTQGYLHGRPTPAGALSGELLASASLSGPSAPDLAPEPALEPVPAAALEPELLALLPVQRAGATGGSSAGETAGPAEAGRGAS